MTMMTKMKMKTSPKVALEAAVQAAAVEVAMPTKTKSRCRYLKRPPQLLPLGRESERTDSDWRPLRLPDE